MTDSTKQRGDRGEDIAAEYVRSLGWTVVERGARFRVGELDIIAEDGKWLVFVEVRSLWRITTVRPEDSITRPKQRKLTLAARLYLARYRGRCPYARFDVVAVDRRREVVSAHYRAAFEAVGGS
ncbi:MAG: putative endonuclease [Bradymonadia bacterium]|jgi:putative endonuclease